MHAQVARGRIGGPGEGTKTPAARGEEVCPCLCACATVWCVGERAGYFIITGSGREDERAVLAWCPVGSEL
jgi:hypothetical protein